MRIRSAICAFLLLALLCAPFQAAAETRVLPDDLKVINSLAFAGLKVDKVVFPDGIEFIADDAFYGAEFVGSGKRYIDADPNLLETGKKESYAYHWCVNHGFAWEPTDTEETTEEGETKKLVNEVNYSGRTIWQDFVQKAFLKATVRNNSASADAEFDASQVNYNIRMTFHISEVFNKVNMQTRLNSIEIKLKGWNGDDEDDNRFASFQKDTEDYTTVYRADWVRGKAYNVSELMYDERGNVVQYYDEKSGEWLDKHEHHDLRPEVWEDAVLTVNTANDTVSIYHPGDLERDHHVYVMDNKHCPVTRTVKNLIIDPLTGLPYKKLRVKITASFNNTSRIALEESVIDNVFVNVVKKTK